MRARVNKSKHRDVNATKDKEMKRIMAEWKRIQEATKVASPEALTEDLLAAEERAFQQFEVIKDLEAEKNTLHLEVSRVGAELTRFEDQLEAEAKSGSLVALLEKQRDEATRALQFHGSRLRRDRRAWAGPAVREHPLRPSA